MLDPKTGEVLALASTPTYDASAIADPETAKATFEGLQDDADQPLLPRATLGRYVPGSVFKIVTAVAGLGSDAITPETTFKEQPGGREERAARRRLPGPRRPPPVDRLDGPGPDGRDRGLVQHLLRADRARDRRRGARRVRRADGLRVAAPVRPADRGVAGDQRRRQAAGRLHRRRRAGERVVRPGRDVRDAAPDGARGLDRREWRRADAAPAGHLDDRASGAGRGPSGRIRWAGSWRRRTRTRSSPRWSPRSRATSGRSSRRAPRSRASRPRASPGTAELGGTGEPHSWFIGFAPAEDPKVVIAVIVEQAGRGGEVAAPIAGDLMTLYLKGGG